MNGYTLAVDGGWAGALVTHDARDVATVQRHRWMTHFQMG